MNTCVKSQKRDSKLSLMDFLLVLKDYEVLICRKCQYVINPARLAEHFRTQHALEIQRVRASAVTLAKQCSSSLQLDLLPPYNRKLATPRPDSLPLEGLLVQNGYGCSLCPTIRRDETAMSHHYTQEHPFKRQKGQKPWTEVVFQQFTRSGLNKTMFRVRRPTAREHEQNQRREDVVACCIKSSCQARIMKRLDQEEAALASRSTERLAHIRPTEISPWLETTRWHQYLGTYPLRKLAALTDLNDTTKEPLLDIIGRSLERVVNTAYQSIVKDKINVFDQLRINTFQSTGRLFSRPLLVKLQKGTWRTYTALWKKFLCFVVRSTRPDQPIILPHVLTHNQQQSLEALLACAKAELNSGQCDHRLEASTDRACLFLCIGLLDHRLRGSLFESVALGFLAVLGIDTNNETLRDAASYTPVLSQFIKIGQLLMVQRAVLEVDEHRAEYPSDILEEMCGRFMVDNTSSPLAWAIRLRSFGKKIKTSTTSQGSITWSEDQETLSYKDIELTMSQFRNFVAQLLVQAQKSLRHLLLLHDEEEVIATVPRLPLNEIKDNPANTTHGWCFLHDHRNQHIFQPGERWLIQRILGKEWLQNEFVQVAKEGDIEWKDAAIKEYNAEAASFLRLLLLLVHLTAGQPARGTELMSLRYLNGTYHRNVFIEHGLVAVVTSYHKGYSIQGSTKIIHRYIPRPVSELLVYYLWLVVPFSRQLELLTNASTTSTTQPWLWSIGLNTAPWTSSNLSTVLQRQSGKLFRKELNLQTYRQIAIAISRTHLPSGGFKVDYGIEQKVIDAQAAHDSNLAGSIYARGLQQAHGQMEARQAIFRAVSREWHEFLGFCRSFGPRKRRCGHETSDNRVEPVAKRRKGLWEELSTEPEVV